MYRKVAAALVAALALAIASCGGSEPELTRAQLVRRVEMACREGQRAAERRPRTADRSDGVATFVSALAVGQEATIDRIGDLDAPEEIQDEFDAFKQGMEDRLALIQRAAGVDREELQRVIREIQGEAEAVTRRISVAARSLGIDGCA